MVQSFRGLLDGASCLSVRFWSYSRRQTHDLPFRRGGPLCPPGQGKRFTLASVIGGIAPRPRAHPKGTCLCCRSFLADKGWRGRAAPGGKGQFRASERGLLCLQRQSNQNAAQTYGFGISLARYGYLLSGMHTARSRETSCSRFKYDPVCFLASLPLTPSCQPLFGRDAPGKRLGQR